MLVTVTALNNINENLQQTTNIIGENLNSVKESNERVAESILEIIASSNTLVTKIEEVGENGIMSLGSIASNIESIENEISNTLVTKIEEVGENGIMSLGSIASNIESIENEINDGNDNNNNGLTSVENEIRTSMLEMSKATEDSLKALTEAIRKVYSFYICSYVFFVFCIFYV